ncbi:hypothetical protein EPO15_11460, partial [bacterium]
DTKALNGLAGVQADAGNYEAAVETARRVLEINPRDTNAYGMVKMYKDRAAPTNEIAGGGQPGGTQFFNRQDASGDYGKGAVSLTVNQTASRQAPAGLRESVELADTAARMMAVRDPLGAKNAAEKALALYPDNVSALRTLARYYMQNKDYTTALGFLDHALGLQMKPEDRNTILLDKSGALSMLRRFDEALVTADSVLQDSPTNGRAYLMKSLALSGMGRDAEALATLGQGAKYDPLVKALFERASSLPPDADLFAFLSGDKPAAAAAAPKESPHRFRWAVVAGGVLAGLLLVVLGVTQGGTLVTSVTRGLGRMGSASPSVQPMPVGTPAPAALDGLAASGIRIDKKIGQGGMGVVYSGMDTSLERPVAIKKMREEIRTDMRERDRFIKEAKMVAALRHPNIVEIYSIVEDGSDVYLVFEYVTGKTVHDLTYERGALPAGWAIGVIKAVASALDYAHKRGVVHRDLKPSNIMVEEEGMVKVMDFGVARMAKDSLSRMSMTNTVVGTPPYMAPEQEQGIVRKESDVYALAVCLYEMVTGTLPFQGMGAGMLMAKLNGTYVPASRVVQGLPDGFDAVMAQALTPDPDKRLRTAGEFAAALSA